MIVFSMSFFPMQLDCPQREGNTNKGKSFEKFSKVPNSTSTEVNGRRVRPKPSMCLEKKKSHEKASYAVTSAGQAGYRLLLLRFPRQQSESDKPCH